MHTAVGKSPSALLPVPPNHAKQVKNGPVDYIYYNKVVVVMVSVIGLAMGVGDSWGGGPRPGWVRYKKSQTRKVYAFHV